MSEKSQRVWDFTVSRPSQILPNNEKLEIVNIPGRLESNRSKSGESGAFLFSRRIPKFCTGRQSFLTNENSNVYRRGRRRPDPSAMDFAHYQSPKLLGTSPPIANKHGVSVARVI